VAGSAHPASQWRGSGVPWVKTKVVFCKGGHRVWPWPRGLCWGRWLLAPFPCAWRNGPEGTWRMVLMREGWLMGQRRQWGNTAGGMGEHGCWLGGHGLTGEAQLMGLMGVTWLTGGQHRERGHG